MESYHCAMALGFFCEISVFDWYFCWFRRHIGNNQTIYWPPIEFIAWLRFFSASDSCYWMTAATFKQMQEGNFPTLTLTIASENIHSCYH